MAAEPFLIEVLSDVVRCLNRKAVDFALAGGLAYSALVESRATTDVDLVLILEDPTAEKVAGLFGGVFDTVVPHREPMVLKGLRVWRLVGVRGEREIVVDLLLAHSEFLRQALVRKRVVDFRGLALPILTLEDLMLLKALASRLQDQADLERIKERPDLRIDWGYVRTWLARLCLPRI